MLLPTIALSNQAVSDFKPLESEIEQQMKRQGIPGVALAVVSEGKVVYSKGFGVTSVENPVPMTPEVLFRLGSTAKIVTALSALILADQKRLELEEPIGSYVKGLPAFLGRVTMTQLLNHTAGLADDAPQDGPHDETALSDNIRSWKEDRVLAEPEEVFSYANTGYVLAGYVLEQVTGKRFADVTAELVLRPLGLPRSTFRPFLAVTYPFALGHQPTREGPGVLRPFPDHAGSWPPGSLFSSAEEFSRLLIALMDKGRVDSRQVLPEKVVERVLGPVRNIDMLGVDWGWGMFHSRESDGAVYLPGGRAGFGSSYYMLPGRHVGAIAMTNLSGVNFRSFAQAAVNVLIPTQTARPAAVRPAAIPMDADEMQRYSGLYVNGPAIQARLEVRDGRLEAVMGLRRFPVEKIGDYDFRASGAAQLERFRLKSGADGRLKFLLAEAWALKKVS